MGARAVYGCVCFVIFKMAHLGRNTQRPVSIWGINVYICPPCRISWDRVRITGTLAVSIENRNRTTNAECFLFVTLLYKYRHTFIPCNVKGKKYQKSPNHRLVCLFSICIIYFSLSFVIMAIGEVFCAASGLL